MGFGIFISGAKFGGYGSFLPTYERSPTVWSHPKSPQKNQSISRSPNNLTLEVYGKLSSLSFGHLVGRRYICS